LFYSHIDSFSVGGVLELIQKGALTNQAIIPINIKLLQDESAILSMKYSMGGKAVRSNPKSESIFKNGFMMQRF
jgi:hypothetical protein